MIARRIISLLALSGIILGQINLTGNGMLRYGESKSGYLYSETILNLNAYQGNFSGWIQMEYSQPPELGRPFSGLRKFRLEYRKDKSLLKIGDIYEIWGRGLVLNSYEDQSVDFDNSLRGLLLKTEPVEGLEWTLLTGSSDEVSRELSVNDPPYSERVPNYFRSHTAMGSNIDYSRGKYFFGASYLQSWEKHPTIDFSSYPANPDTIRVFHRINGLRTGYMGDWFDLFAEYAEKKTYDYDPLEELKSFIGMGRGFYGSLNLYLNYLVLTLNYKKYDFNSAAPGIFSVRDDYSGVIGYQNLPTVITEHSTHLLNRISHKVNPNDEAGYQLELQGAVGEYGNLIASYSHSSQNATWKQVQVPFDSTGMFMVWDWKEMKKTEILPLKDIFSRPFNELYIGYSDNGRSRLEFSIGAALTSNVIDLYSNQVTDSTRFIMYEDLKALTIPLALDWKVSQRWNVSLKYEYQQLEKKLHREISVAGVDTAESRFPDPVQYNGFLSIGLSRSPVWSLNLQLDAISSQEFGTDRSGDITNPLERFVGQFISLENRWIAVEFLVNISPSQALTLTYGSQQGGVLCSNGVCRQVASFEDGFRIGYSTIF